MLLDHRGNPLESLKIGNGEVVPHVYTFASILNQTSEMYSYRWDEAVKHNPENALAMKRDCYIRSLIQERAYPTVNREWSIKPEDDKDPVQKATAEHMKKMLLATPHWKKMLEYLVSGGLWYGRYGSQITWGDKNILGVKRRVIVKHKPVNGDKLQFSWGDTPAVFINTTKKTDYPDEYIRTTDRNPALILAKPQWRQQFIIHTHTIEDSDFFEGEMAGTVNGTGLRNLIYWAWWLRDEMLSWCVDFMKKVGTLGLLIFPYEMSNKESKLAAETNAKKASRDIALTMPVYMDKMGSALMPMHVAGNTSGVEALQGMIADYFERHIERMVVGQSMSAGGGGAGGLEGDGRAEFAKDTKFQLLHFDADNIADTLTEDVVSPMQAMNFKDYGFDFKLRMEFMVEKPENVEKVNIANSLIGMGIELKTDEVRELGGFSKPEPHDDKVGGQEQLYAQHGIALSRLLQEQQRIQGGGVEPPADGGFDEDVMQLMADASPELFSIKNGIPHNEMPDPGDWKPTKSGKGEYSPSTGHWRPKGSTQNVKHRLTPDIGYRVGRSHHTNLSATVQRLQQRSWMTPEGAKSYATSFGNDAARHERKNFIGRFKRLKEQVGENHDQSVFKSPEWEAVKNAHRDGLDSVLEHLHAMTEHVHDLADRKKQNPDGDLKKSDLDPLDEHRDNHKKAHDEAFDNIKAAAMSFFAKHGGGKGGAVHLESDDDDLDLYQKKWGGMDHPFGNHSPVGRNAEQRAGQYNLKHSDVHALAQTYHKTLGYSNDLKGHREAYKTAIGHLRLHQITANAAKPPIIPELVHDGTKGPPFAEPVKQPGGSGTNADPFTLDPEPAKPASQPAAPASTVSPTAPPASTFPMQLPQAHPKMAVKPHMPPPPPMPGAAANPAVQHNPDNTSAPKAPAGEATDWQPTKSGRGEYSPSTHKWRPIGEHVQTPGLGKDHHESMAAKHKDARKANLDATLGMLRGMKGNGRFMDEAKKHPTLGKLMSGQQVSGGEMSKLHDEVGKVKASYGDDGWMLDGMHGLIGDQMKHRENEAESRFHADNWKEPPVPSAEGGPQREPDWDEDDDAFDTDTERKDGTDLEDDDHVSKAHKLLKDHTDHVYDTHNDHVDEHNQILGDLQKLVAKNWINAPHKNMHPSVLRKKMNNGEIEQADDIPGLDVMATDMARNYPAHFNDREDDMSVTDQLFEKLKEGKRKRLTREEAEKKALEEIENMHGERERQDDMKKPDDEEIPFQCLTVVDMYELVA